MVSRFVQAMRLAPALGLWLAVAGAGLAPTTLPNPVMAGTAVVDGARIAALGDRMQLGPLLAVMREEGLAYGASLDHDMLGDAGGVNWKAEVAQVYDPALRRKMIDAALLKELGQDDATASAMEGFFASSLGTKIAGLEVAARRAFLDDAAKDAAAVAWQDMVDQHDPRVGKLKHMVEVLGLIDLNVEGTLNANLAFYQGLAEGGGMTDAPSQSDMLAEVAGQEQQARAASEAWIYSFLTLAYQPLSDAELDQYLAYIDTPAAQKGNRAISAAFDVAFAAISHDLGLAVSRRMSGQDI